jgi:hypothetical protein
MKPINPKRCMLGFLYVVTTLLISSCASTKVLSTWKDTESTNAPLKKVLVMTVLPSQTSSNLLEDAFSSQLRQDGVETVLSDKVFAQQPSKEKVLEYAARNRIDSVLVSRLTGENEERVYYPPPTAYWSPYPYYSRWDSYYPHIYDYRGNVATYKYYYLETNVYEVSSKKLIWSATTETLEPENVAKETQVLAEKIVKAMKDDGLV